MQAIPIYKYTSQRTHNFYRTMATFICWMMTCMFYLLCMCFALKFSFHPLPFGSYGIDDGRH